MSEQEDQKTSKKSIPDLRAIQSNVVPIDDGKKKRTPGEKIKMRDIHHSVVLAMLGKNPVWPPFPATLHKITDRRGETMIFLERDGLVSEISDNAVESIIAHYWQKALRDTPRPVDLGAMAADDAAKIRKLWLVSAPGRKNDFPLVVWKSDLRPAFHRIPFDPIPVDQLANAAPLFAELMSRTTNATGFMAFLGSLLDDRSQRQQYVWMHGHGGNGKGALMRALASAFSDVASSEQPPQQADKFWTWGLLGKRLVIFPDCNNASFVTSGLFKTLTGEDRVRIERKGGAIFSAELPGKFLFVSNNRPQLSSQASDMRRVIFCHVGQVTTRVPCYEDRLRAEIPAILSACWWAYQHETAGDPRALYPIENREEVEEVAADAEHEYAAFVDQYCGFCDDDPSKPDKDKPYVSLGDMKDEMIRAGFKDEFSRRKLRDYLAQRHGIKPKLVKYGEGRHGQVRRVYINIKLFKRVEGNI